MAFSYLVDILSLFIPRTFQIPCILTNIPPQVYKSIFFFLSSSLHNSFIVKLLETSKFSFLENVGSSLFSLFFLSVLDDHVRHDDL